MKRVLVTGAGGFVGARILDMWRGQFALCAFPSDTLRTADENAVLRFILKEHPDVIVHTAALSNTQVCQQHPEESFRANVLLPEWVAKGAEEVGAKLLSPDDTIQHAGVCFGIGGVAGHLHKYYPASSDGYMGRLNYVQDVYADTAACLLIRKEIYDEVGGLDESYAVAFNDVDFCVRVRQAGYTNVFTPFAQLYHYESKSRGMEDNPEKQKRFQGEVLRFQARWGDLLAAGDPCTNPNFDIQREDFSLKILPLE